MATTESTLAAELQLYSMAPWAVRIIVVGY